MNELIRNTVRTLIPSYSDKDERNSDRFKLCEIVYEDYKGTTFHLTQMLEEKKQVLKKLKTYIKSHPELASHYENSAYWYPFKNVDGTRSLNPYSEYYPNTQKEITYFCQEGKDNLNHSDYLFDPVKLQVLIMCKDLRDMDLNSDVAQEIIKINNNIFKLLFDTIGDTINYSGENTFEQINNIIQASLQEQEKIEASTEYTQELKEMILKRTYRFNENIHYIQEAMIICQYDKLNNAIPTKSQSGMKNKI